MWDKPLEKEKKQNWEPRRSQVSKSGAPLRRPGGSRLEHYLPACPLAADATHSSALLKLLPAAQEGDASGA